LGGPQSRTLHALRRKSPYGLPQLSGLRKVGVYHRVLIPLVEKLTTIHIFGEGNVEVCQVLGLYNAGVERESDAQPVTET
jgi:hypothetical protein